MGVFDPRQGQVLPSPIRQYYRGKAIRQDLKDKEQMAELRQKQIDSFDDSADLEKRRVEIAEKRAALEEERFNLETKKWESTVGRDNAEALNAEAYEAVKQIDSIFVAGDRSPEAEQAALAAGVGAFKRYAASVSKLDPERGEAINQFLADGVLTTEEYQQMRGGVIAGAKRYGTFEAEDLKPVQFIGDDGQPHMGTYSNGEYRDASGMVHTKASPIIKGSNKAKPDTAKPIPVPTRTESEIINDFTKSIFEDERYEDYGFDDKEKTAINRWVGDAAERIQRLGASRNQAMGYADAVERATQELHKFIVPPGDPGFFTNDTNVFTAPVHNIGDVIKGQDGVSYVVTGYNEQGGPRGEPIG
jgi:hypothetical protein